MGEFRQEQLIAVAYAKSVFEAQTKAAVLNEVGIEAVVPDFDGEMFAATKNQRSNTTIPVLVKVSDVMRAKEELAIDTNQGIRVDWDKVDVGEMDESKELSNRKSGLYCLLGVVIIILIISLLIQFL